MTRMLFYRVAVNEPDTDFFNSIGLNIATKRNRILTVNMRGPQVTFRDGRKTSYCYNDGLVLIPYSEKEPSETFFSDYGRYLLTKDGVLFERTAKEPLGDEEYSILNKYGTYCSIKQYLQACADGEIEPQEGFFAGIANDNLECLKRTCGISSVEEYERVLQKFLVVNYKKIEPLSPLDPMITVEHEFSNRAVLSDDYGLTCPALPTDTGEDKRGTPKQISCLVSDMSRKDSEIDTVFGYASLKKGKFGKLVIPVYNIKAELPIPVFDD